MVLTEDPLDRGLFKVPTLRNIAVTVPNMNRPGFTGE